MPDKPKRYERNDSTMLLIAMLFCWRFKSSMIEVELFERSGNNFVGFQRLSFRIDIESQCHAVIDKEWERNERK